jgi:regulator of sirC expression with transglutaminase-like and TPR domain
MKETKEIAALLHLIEDPDEEVYVTVRERLISYGQEVIPNLEYLWETTENPFIQERVEMLIHGVQYEDVKRKFKLWLEQDQPDLLTGAMILNSYHFPELATDNITLQLEKLRRNIWLELNPYLTPLEHVNVLTGIVFQYCSYKKVATDYKRPADFLIAQLLESKRGNALSLTILMLILARLTEIPMAMLQIPGQFILAYHKPHEPLNLQHIREQFPFFIDGGTGQIFAFNEIEKYLERNQIELTADLFAPVSEKNIVAILVEAYANCFNTNDQVYKYQELIALAKLIRE